MAELIKMPKMSDTMEQGVISTWLKKVGDQVQAGDILAEVETDKATMELEAYEDGTLLYIGVQEKEAALVNATIAIIGAPDEDITTLLTTTTPTQENQKLSEPATTTTVSGTSGTIPSEKKSNQSAITTDNRLRISPLAKKIGLEKGYDLSKIEGTGDGGRIIKRDLTQCNMDNKGSTTMHTSPMMTEAEGYQDIPISSMRHAIAKVLTESKMKVPHFYLTVGINMNAIIRERTAINDYAGIKISLNDYVVKATAVALSRHPTINAAWLGDTIRYYKHVHIGVAIAIDEGLIVPLVHFATTQSLTQIATTTKALGKKAHEKKLQPKDYEGATFTISNLGMLGIESFTAIINPPAACILAVGAVQQVPVVEEGNIVPAHVMKVTLSCDHRVVDGAVGAAFLNTLKELLEDPIKMLV